MIQKIAENIYWVGVADWGIRHFHGFELSTHRGTTYNSYLVTGEKTALVDCVWDPFAEEFLNNIRQVIEPERIDYVIANHAEPDHSGSLSIVMSHCKNARLIVSKRGADSIPGHHHQLRVFQAVKTGDSIDLGGGKTLTFVEAPMLHWPDSMFTYLAPDGILMPNDAFGQHYATSFRFNDQVNREELYQEAIKYYANILTPFSNQVLAKIDELLGMKLPVKMIAPSHGVIWRDDPLQIVRTYRDWARQPRTRRAVIIYDTMWQATRKMAQAVGDGLAERGVEYKLFHMAISDRNDVLTEIFQAGAVLVGSCTINRGPLPTISPILEDLKGLRFANKIGAAFGSFGWSGEAVKQIQEHLLTCGFELAAPAVLAKWQPRLDDLESCRQLGIKVADALGSHGVKT